MKGETNGNHKRKGRPLRPGDPCEKIQQPASIRIPHRKYNTPAPPCQEEGISVPSADVTATGISLTGHTHTDSMGGSTSGPQ